MPRRDPYSHRRDLPHLQKDHQPIFATFNTENQHHLPANVRHTVLDCCKYVHGRTAYVYIGVVMPEHVHMILTPFVIDERPIPLYEILQSIKSVSARRVNRLLRRKGQLWQEETFDHVIRSSESLYDKIEYVRQNPVRRKLCVRRSIPGCG